MFSGRSEFDPDTEKTRTHRIRLPHSPCRTHGNRQVRRLPGKSPFRKSYPCPTTSSAPLHHTREACGERRWNPRIPAEKTTTRPSPAPSFGRSRFRTAIPPFLHGESENPFSFLSGCKRILRNQKLLFSATTFLIHSISLPVKIMNSKHSWTT